jgi:hypothetical protein
VAGAKDTADSFGGAFRGALHRRRGPRGRAPVLEALVFFLFGLVVGGVPYVAFTVLGEDARTFPWLVVLGGLLTLTFLYTFVGPLAVVWAWPLQLLLSALAAVPFLQVRGNAKI